MLKAQLRAGSKAFFGASEGTQVIQRVGFYNNNNCVAGCDGGRCDVCFTGCYGTGGIWRAAPGSIVINDNYRGKALGLTHEMGHLWFGDKDEYDGPNDAARCGHSLMGITPGDLNAKNFCTQHNHGYNGTPGFPPLPFPSIWSIAATNGIVPSYPIHTPDNYDYVDFSFWDDSTQVERVGFVP